MEKKRIVTSYEKLKPEVKQLLRERYPDGFQDDVMKINKGPDSYFHAVTLDTPEISYLIKVEVKIDSLSELEDTLSPLDKETKMEDAEEGEENVAFDEEDYME